MKEYIIRQPKVNDAKDFVYLINRVNQETQYLLQEPDEIKLTSLKEKKLIRGVLADKRQKWFVAECDGKVVGQISVCGIPGRTRLAHRADIGISVLKDYWHMGIGTALLQNGIDWAKEYGFEQLELSVISCNTRAISLYEKFGFEIVGTIPNAIKYKDGSYADEYKMVKVLK